MAHKKRSNSPQKKSAKAPLSPSTKTPKTPPPIEQADGSPKPTKTSPTSRMDDDSASSMLRCYNIPDYRLEHPEFRIFMSGEGSNLEYQIEGDLRDRKSTRLN